MIGTPKARFLFERDFRSARRGAGIGSVFWEQMKKESCGENSSINNIFQLIWHSLFHLFNWNIDATFSLKNLRTDIFSKIVF